MTFLDQIQTHPKVAFIVGLTHIVAAKSLTLLEIPTIIMQLFQIGAWCSTMIVGTIAFIGWIKKRRKNDKRTH